MGSQKIKILIASALSTLIVYFILVNLYKSYQSEVDILIVPQNEKTAVMQKQVLENASRLPLTVSFFDKLAEETINIENPVEELAPAERKAYWNSKLETKILKDSGIIKFRAFDKDSDQAEKIAIGAAASDIFALSAYYDIRDDVQIRIIDGPINSRTMIYGSFKLVFSSLIFGFIWAIILGRLVSFIQDRVNLQDEFLYTKALPEDAFSVKKNVSAKKTPEAISCEKKASAPGNLPIADNSIMSMFGASKDEAGYKISDKKIEIDSKEEKPAVYREATTEEVKERLNRLLGGM